jgi:hypothetical protein
MLGNVSPVYSFEVTVPTDQDNSNNSNFPDEPKEVIYYIKRSDVSAMVSASHTYIPNLPTNITGSPIS